MGLPVEWSARPSRPPSRFRLGRRHPPEHVESHLYCSSRRCDHQQRPNPEPWRRVQRLCTERIDVDYTNQTWQPLEQSCVALSPGLHTVAFVDPATGQLISNIKTLVAEGLLEIVGYPTLDGQPTRGAEDAHAWSLDA
jgi:hypothetical protein